MAEESRHMPLFDRAPSPARASARARVAVPASTVTRVGGDLDPATRAARGTVYHGRTAGELDVYRSTRTLQLVFRWFLATVVVVILGGRLLGELLLNVLGW